MGARVALEMVRLAPTRIEKMALLDTGIHGLKRVSQKKDRPSLTMHMNMGCRH